jgi:CheY-like chemotaxis protein
MTLEILVVEDNEKFRKAAEEFLKTREVSVTYAGDYAEAIPLLDSRRFGYAAIDCFFPRETGSDDITLGLEAVEKMKKVNPSRRDNVLSRTIEKVELLLGKEFARLAAKNAGVDYNHAVCHYFALEQAMKEAAINQPLGILVAERAESLGIPFVLATSTNHHDLLTQPVCDYAGKKRWRLVDCERNHEDDKGSQRYWARVFEELLAR